MTTPTRCAPDIAAGQAVALLREALRTARRQRHRRMLVLSGAREWGMDRALELLQGCGLPDPLWYSDQPPAEQQVCHGDQAWQALGSEREAVVFDAWSGFDPDAFGALAGTVKAGGVLLLLIPPLDDWHAFNDPVNHRIAVAPYSADALAARYVGRLRRLLKATPDIILYEQGGVMLCPAATEVSNARPRAVEPPCLTADQRDAVEAVLRVVTGHRRRPAVLVSDRGRGKSAAFGIAAARLIAQGRKRILLTGPGLESVRAVLSHARALAPGVDDCIHFVPPDELLRNPSRADLLLVDEAAAIPTAVLASLLKQYSRIAFATTVHGYEGTGRGFAVRFNRILDRETNSWKRVELRAPIRWASGDPLEALVFRLLLLDADPAPAAVFEGADDAVLDIEKLDRDALADDEQTLSELFGLLVLAHYRTRPLDLRHLLDGPNVSVYVMRVRGHVAATALVAEEGCFDSAAADAICSGKSRPHGHLLPETLAAHLGLCEAPLLRGARILRIAVHPALQRRGYGSALLKEIGERIRAAGYDYIGSSFAADTELLRFWRQLGWLPVRVSIQRGTSSGTHSAVMLNAVSERGEALLARARQRFFAQFPHQLSDSLRDIDAGLVSDLMRDATLYRPPLDDDDCRDIEAFAGGQRQTEVVIGSLWKLACRALMDPQCLSRLDAPQLQILVMRLLQKRDWQFCARRVGVPGRAQGLRLLRAAVARLQDC